MAVGEHVHDVRLDVLQDTGVVRDHEDAELVGFLGAVHAFGHDAQGVHVEAGIGLVHDGELRLEQFELEHFGALLLAAGEAHIQIAVSIALIHAQRFHLLGQLLTERKHFDGLAGNGVLGRAQEILQRDAGDLFGGLEREEHAQLCPHIGRLVGHILTLKNDLAAGNGITGVAHQGAHQGGFTGTVVAHQNMGLTGINGQVQTVQKHFLLLAYGNLQIFDFQQGTAHGIHLQMISGTARLGIESRVMR